MGDQKTTETRFCKGTVAVTQHKGGIRLRWSYKGKRPELYISATNEPNALLKGNTIKQIIEQDMVTGRYDEDLSRYKELLRSAAIRELLDEQQHQTVPISRNNYQKQIERKVSASDILREFDRYLVVKDKVDDPNYYMLTRKVLVKWGDFEVDDIPILLSQEKWSAKTFNDRRNCLNAFFEWMKRKKRILDNPIEDLSTKERKRVHPDREPFSDEEAAAILDALRTNRFVKKSSRFDHAQYYPFVAFLSHIGCRPAEAIGLKVRYVRFSERRLVIGNALARTSKGTHAGARVYKATKNHKVRYVPLDDFLTNLLSPLCSGKGPDDFVFQNANGNPIDDKMFLRRVLKPVQEELKIPTRVTYAFRHTFATRAVQQGMKAHEVAYLMGDTVETVLVNYFHNNQMPAQLPSGVASRMWKTLSRVGD
ncbi:MAG: site-specific integrase [Proteobacteria bacterium]|nr:MAG: site-specific integrase [Pseudomonadota bacterium]